MRLKSVLTPLIGVVMLLVAATPVAADTSMSHTGVVGPHRLVDTSSRPGMTCEMSQLPSGYWTMHAVSVRPPRMRGTRDGQRVAWRFTIQRSATGPWNWQTYYRSPLQYGTADVHTPAAFYGMSAWVSGSGFYWHRVRVKMFWYRANGTLVGTAKHAVDYYREGATGNVYEAPCGYDLTQPE